jgi:methionyl-tRNA formyltransferase
MRIVFAGTPDFAAVALNALLTADYPVVGVYTQPDRPSGRGRKLTPSPVKAVALEHDLPVCQPESFQSEESRATLAAFEPDVMVVAAYGLLLPQAVLDVPRFGCLNIHASLLPRWRGAAPIQRAIAEGDTRTGITIMQMEAGLDTGPMLLTSTTAIADNETGGSLHDRLADMGGKAILEGLEALSAGDLHPQIQNDADASYAHKLTKADGHIDWQRSAVAIDRQIRAFNPWPGAWCDNDETRLRIHEAHPLSGNAGASAGTILRRDHDGIDVACGEGRLRLTRVQLPGSRAQSASDLINGGRDVLHRNEVLR